MTLALPAPGPLGIVAWSVAVAVVSGAFAVRRPLAPAWVVGAMLPAILGQIGTWRAAPGRAFPYEDPTASAAALAAAVAPEAHGYLAGALVALVLAGVARARAREPRRPRVGAPSGVVGAMIVAALAGAPSVWLLVGAGIALALSLLASSGREPAGGLAALVGVGLTWLGARHFLLFELHHPLASGRVDGLVEVLAWRTHALEALTVAGPGWAVATAAAAWTALRAARPRGVRALIGGLATAAGLGALAVLGAVNTGALAPLHSAVAGGVLPRGLPILPEIRRAAPAEGRCLAWPSEQGWRLVHRWSPHRCPQGGPVVVAAPADGVASQVFRAPWLASGAPLEILGAPPVEASSGPLAALSWRAVAVRWVQGPLPPMTAPDASVHGQLDAWLDEQLGEPDPGDPRRSGVWLLDRPEGEMILLAAGGGVTLKGRRQRRAVVDRLLGASEEPRLVLVLGGRWTVQDAVDRCVDARASRGAHLPCVWVSAR